MAVVSLRLVSRRATPLARSNAVGGREAGALCAAPIVVDMGVPCCGSNNRPGQRPHVDGQVLHIWEVILTKICLLWSLQAVIRQALKFRVYLARFTVSFIFDF